jgi:hypothetical protein
MRKLDWSYQKINAFWLLLFGFAVLFLPVCLIEFKVLHYTHGVFIYPFDDTFIHLKIADMLQKGNWGINENEFASASSSIQYTLLLALALFFSKSVTIPFIVNGLAGIVILFSLHSWLRRQQVNLMAQALIILLSVFFAPLALLIVSGMEHTLQCLFSFLFAFYFSDWLDENKEKHGPLPLKILVFSILASTIRYEGLFLIATACFLLLVYKKIFNAFVLGLVALTPLVVFGLISWYNGNYFLPNSVLVKSQSFVYSSPLQLLYDIVFERLVYARNGMAALATQRLTIAIPLLYFLFRRFLKPSYFFILVILFGTTILQLAFASTGYLYRYEAYLFFCFMIIAPVLFYKYGRYVFAGLDSIVSKIIALALAFFLLFPVVIRSVTALDKTTQACINIYDQQYQMAIFAQKYYNRSTVALNDIGAMAYFTNGKIVDLWGLANVEVTKSKKLHYWTTGFLDSLCKSKGVEFAMIYDSWFPDSLIQRWNKAATWQIQNNIICGDSVVSFYTMDSSRKIPLQQKLKAFEPQLPRSVLVKYY